MKGQKSGGKGRGEETAPLVDELRAIRARRVPHAFGDHGFGLDAARATEARRTMDARERELVRILDGDEAAAAMDVVLAHEARLRGAA